MFQVLSLMECSPVLQKIEAPACGNNVFAAIDFIHQNYRGRPLPLQVKLLHQDTVLVRVVIRGDNGSESSESSFYSPNAVTVTVLGWIVDHVYNSIQDSGAQLLNVASQKFPLALEIFTLDITALTAQGLSNVSSTLHRSALEHLRIKCMPFMPFLEPNIVSILKAVQWPLIKALVLTGNNINNWLHLWASDGDLQDMVGA